MSCFNQPENSLVGAHNNDWVNDRNSHLTGEGFADFFVKVIASYKDHTAFHYRHNGEWHSLSFSELKQTVDPLVAWFASQQINSHSRIAIVSESRMEWPIVLFAAWLRGAIVVPLDEKMSASELQSAIDSFKPPMIAVSPSCFKHHQDTLIGKNILVMDMHQQYDDMMSLTGLAPVDEIDYHRHQRQDAMLIASTSSTSGDRKGVMLNWNNISHQINALGSCFNVGAQNAFLSVLPLHHMLELSCGLLTVLSKGARICYLGSLLPDEILQTIQTKSVTHMVGVPMLAEMLGKRMRQYESRGKAIELSLGTLIIGGAQLNSENVTYFASHNIDLLQGYGLTEASPVVTLNLRPEMKPDSIGQPLPSVAVKIDTADKDSKTGEILVKGPNIMLGYYNDDALSQATIRQGWLHTGDIGYQDQDGYVYITGRLKNMIVLTSGKNVSAEEVEACIQTYPHVREVCVMGVQLFHNHHHSETVQICALIVLNDDADKERIIDEVQHRCAQLSPYKRPQHILVYDQGLPKTATGKIKKQLAQSIARDLIMNQSRRDH
jgi:long-chain acyl-CoA synthetase